MSQYGPPPPGPDHGQQPEQQPGAPAGPPPESPGGYNPYPDSWSDAPSGNPAFHASAPPSDNPYGQPAPYGTPPPTSNPYTGQNPSRTTFGFGGYAGWFTRVGAYVIDQILGSVAATPLWLGYVILWSNTSTTTNPDGTTTSEYSGSVALPVILIGIGGLTSLAFYIWNICIRQGRTGASIGKSVLAIRLVNSDLQPIGPGWSFLRSILHIVDALPCYLGYFWPIWDSQKQTFADKIMSTYVIQATTPPPPPYA